MYLATNNRLNPTPMTAKILTTWVKLMGILQGCCSLDVHGLSQAGRYSSVKVCHSSRNSLLLRAQARIKHLRNVAMVRVGKHLHKAKSRLV